ncbi:hypothetical protein [Brevibacterium atlanticum]|uniref:hypothetical protein n=1 Tax=Brevibacterium atlanticum TaxID=2697563 RepID=UPI0014248E83|nr:hypothetical protein [Brevibacterium atlanticum]
MSGTHLSFVLTPLLNDWELFAVGEVADSRWGLITHMAYSSQMIASELPAGEPLQPEL